MKYCTKCGQPILDDAKFCGVCGAPVEVMPDVQPAPVPAQPTAVPVQPAPQPEAEKTGTIPGLAVAGFMLFVTPFLAMMLYLLVLNFMPISNESALSLYTALTSGIISAAYMIFALAFVFTILGMVKSVKRKSTGGIVLSAMSMLCLVLSIAGLPVILQMADNIVKISL